MPNLPISSMAVAAQVDETDAFPIVSGAGNFKVTRPIFLTGRAGQSIGIAAGGGSITISNAGAIELLVSAPSQLKVNLGNGGSLLFLSILGNSLEVDASGALSLKSFGAGDLTLVCGNATFSLQNAGGARFVSLTGGQLSGSFTYVGMHNAFYVNPGPADMAAALNWLAKAVSGLLGTPIPPFP